MCMKSKPFIADTMDGLMNKILNEEPAALAQGISQDLSCLISSLLNKSPKQRPSIDQLLSQLNIV